MRVLLTLSVILVILVILAALRWGWQRRRVRQSEFALADSVASPTDLDLDRQDWGPADSIVTVPAKYIGTARAQDLFERIVAGGGPAQAQLLVGKTAIAVAKPGKTQLPLTADSLITVGTAPGLLQKSYHRHGLLMITWRWNDQDVVSGFWIADPKIQQEVLAAVKQVAQVSSGSQGGN